MYASIWAVFRNVNIANTLNLLFEFVLLICFQMRMLFLIKRTLGCDNDNCGTFNLLNLMKAHYIRELLSKKKNEFPVNDL